jgi:tripartite-type tricarboxylate transporter receptor subunit TctC
MQKAVTISRRSLVFAGASALVASALPAAAQPAWPTRPIKIVAPSAAGGASDFVARTFAHYMEGQMVPPVVIDNKPGASSIIGAEAVKSARPDGYTFLESSTSTESANSYIYAQLPYDPQKDFVEVGLFGVFPMIGLVKPDGPLKSLADIIKQGQTAATPPSYGFYSATSQVPPELIRARTGGRALAVRYKNITQIIVDLAAGRIDYAFLDEMSAAPAIKGLVVPIAMTSGERDPNMPNVPTVAEILPGFELQTWTGVSAPAGTPDSIVNRMNAYMGAATADPTVRKTLEEHGMTVRHNSPQEQTAFVAEERKRWAEFVRTAQIQPQ